MASGIIGVSSGAVSNDFGVASDSTGTGFQRTHTSGATVAIALFSFTEMAHCFRNLPLTTSQTMFWTAGNAAVANCRLSITGFSF